MKPSLTITTTILASVLAAGLASAQSPSIIQNTRATMNGVRDNSAAASNAALAMQDQAPSAAQATQASPKASQTVSAAASQSAPKQAKPLHTGAAHRKHEPKEAAAVSKPVTPVALATASAAAPEEKSATDDQAAPDNKWNANGKRDPFVSPVVSHAGGSGCSTGKKCLEIGTINLRGIVHAESGFIAVVSNGLNKAYFLHENDPVFNGYVVKITGDSIVFQETLQDRLGKSFTREVVKKITTPAV